MDESKDCSDCGGDGLCPECNGEGQIGCFCECGDIHQKKCGDCDGVDYEYGDGKCAMCHGTGKVGLTDKDREGMGQITIGGVT